MDREVFERLKEQADHAREAFRARGTSGIYMDGAFTMAPSRAQMRKVKDLQSKEFYVKRVLSFVEEQGGSTTGIVPHPAAWKIDIVDDIVYAFTIDGKDVECVYDDEGLQHLQF